MIRILSVAGIFFFAVASQRIKESREQDDSTENNQVAYALVVLSVLAVLSAVGVSNDLSVFVRAIITGTSLASVALAASYLVPGGIGLLDAAAMGFVGFTIGVTSWELAWSTAFAALIVTGVLAAIDLVRHDDRERRVHFAIVLSSVALAAIVIS